MQNTKKHKHTLCVCVCVCVCVTERERETDRQSLTYEPLEFGLQKLNMPIKLFLNLHSTEPTQ